MRSRGGCFAILLSILSAGSVTASPEAGAVRYALTKESMLEAGCLPPCMCPVLIRAPIQGTFDLVPTGFDGLFQNFDVVDVDWALLIPGGQSVHVAGADSYRLGGQVAQQHQMILDLVVGDEPQQRYDSGLVAGGGDFPAIAIPVALHGFFCRDSVYGVQAQPIVAGVGDRKPGAAGLRVSPNPFHARADVAFALHAAGRVDLKVYDLGGRLVRTLAQGRWLETGTHTLGWDGTRSDGGRVPAGLYFVRLKAGGRDTRGTLVKF